MASGAKRRAGAGSAKGAEERGAQKSISAKRIFLGLHSSQDRPTLAVIGGSGLAKMVEGRMLSVKTPFEKEGEGPVRIVRGKIRGRGLLFLPRHGPEHTVPPHNINHQAHLYALADMGATHVLSVTAVGSTEPELLRIGDLVVVRDFLKLTPGPTFFATFVDGAFHAPMDVPFSPRFSGQILREAASAKIEIKDEGVLAETFGPRYETKAEIRLLRLAGVNLVGMTAPSETILANEARLMGLGIQNATLAIVTNFATGTVKDKIDHGKVKAVVMEREEDIGRIVYNLIPIIGQGRGSHGRKGRATQKGSEPRHLSRQHEDAIDFLRRKYPPGTGCFGPYVPED